MNILLAGGSGFLGKALTQAFAADGHRVFVLTRRAAKIDGAEALVWDAENQGAWSARVNEMDVVVHLAGKSLSTFPWTKAVKRQFVDSRVKSGEALVAAIEGAERRPAVFVQASGINYYGLHGALAGESTPPADDFLAQLAVQWEAATQPLEALLGIRRIVVRSAVVLDRKGGMYGMTALPARLGFGGRLGSGEQAFPWIHIRDWVEALRYLLAQENAAGAYNFVAPRQTSNAEFMRALASTMKRPFWFHTPEFLMRAALGEMSVLILDGRFSQPKRLLESGYQFQFSDLQKTLAELNEEEKRVR